MLRRAGYLAEVAATVRGYHQKTEEQAAAARRVQQLAAVRAELTDDPERVGLTQADDAAPASAERAVADLLDRARRAVTEDSAALLENWPAVVTAYSGDEQVDIFGFTEYG